MPKRNRKGPCSPKSLKGDKTNLFESNLADTFSSGENVNGSKILTSTSMRKSVLKKVYRHDSVSPVIDYMEKPGE